MYYIFNINNCSIISFICKIIGTVFGTDELFNSKPIEIDDFASGFNSEGVLFVQDS